MKILIFTLFLIVSLVNCSPVMAYDASNGSTPPITLPKIDEGYFLGILNEIVNEAGRYVGQTFGTTPFFNFSLGNGGGLDFNQLPNIVSGFLANALDTLKNLIAQLIEMARGYNPKK